MIRAIVGANWGDEGKGKMTDLLGGKADVVVRFQGGANAGHTILNEYGKFALHLLPSGVFRKNVTNVIAQGVALDLDKLFGELDALVEAGVPAPKLLVSDRAQILIPYHILFDTLEEERLAGKAFGSTRSGIAPFYAEKYLKTGIQVCDLFEDEALMDKLTASCNKKNLEIEAIYHKDIRLNPQEFFDHLVSLRDRLAPIVGDVAVFLNECIKQDKEILLEGQLGSLKDPDNGIYPFVTSSSPLAGYASVSCGIPARKIEEVYTVVKAYSSAVGAGAFVSEIFGDEAKELRDRGGDNGEYGATTGRPRRVGWFDVVATKYGCMLQGTTHVVLSLLDVLGYLDEIPVCVGYEIDGQVTTNFPVTPKLNRAKPIIEKLPGWKQDLRGVKNYDELPENAKKYIAKVEELLGFPIAIVSTGPKRDDIIRMPGKASF